MSLRFLTFMFWIYYVLKLLILETITFSDASLSDIYVVLCYVLSQYRLQCVCSVTYLGAWHPGGPPSPCPPHCPAGTGLSPRCPPPQHGPALYALTCCAIAKGNFTLQRKSHLCIPFLGIARPQPQFQHSCVCERFIQFQDRPKYFLQRNRQTERGNI
jgi:hypothetical protein